MKRLLILLVALVALLGHKQDAWAQQQPQFSHYGFNGMFLSPGYAGITDFYEFNMLGRYQWLGYEGSFDGGGAPRTGLFSASLPVRALKGGLGVVVTTDHLASTGITTAQLSYAYHVAIGEGKLGIGVQGSMANIRKGSYRANEPTDPRVPYNSSDSKFDMGAGVWYQSDNLQAGLGVTNLLGSVYQFENIRRSDTLGSVTGARHLFLTGAYNLPVSDMLVVTPTAIYKHDLQSNEISFEVGGRATYNEKIYAGVGYRHMEAVTGMAGIYMMQDNALRFGYALDLTTFNPDAKSLTSHEVMLSYRFPQSPYATRPPIRTPRYNF
jgi:type IX secretion system PorP/SprF family membrane protein